MAFYFLPEDGTGVTNANSFTSVEFADDYSETVTTKTDAWLALEEDQKQRLLVRASKQLDVRFVWNGYRVDPTSGLGWPRAGVESDGCLIPDDVVPVILQEATVEFALYLMDTDWTSPRDNDQFREIQVDVIDLKFDTDYRRGYLPPTVMQMLSELGYANSGSGKMGFKPVIRS